MPTRALSQIHEVISYNPEGKPEGLWISLSVFDKACQYAWSVSGLYRALALVKLTSVAVSLVLCAGVVRNTNSVIQGLSDQSHL